VDPRIRIIVQIIEEKNASIGCDLAEMSKILGLSDAHLLRLFHREVGKTFRGYLRDVRMRRAADLRKGNGRCIKKRSIKEVAHECGYGDVSNFYRDFKAVYAATPKEIRLRGLGVLSDLTQLIRDSAPNI
jgi:AraC family transcriptional regulator, activator of mtrCDE